MATLKGYNNVVACLGTYDLRVTSLDEYTLYMKVGS